MWHATEAFLGLPLSVQAVLLLCWAFGYIYLVTQNRLAFWLNDVVEEWSLNNIYKSEHERITCWLNTLDTLGKLTGTRLVLLNQKEIFPGDEAFLSHLNDLMKTDMPWLVHDKLLRVRKLILEGRPAEPRAVDYLFCIAVAPILSLLAVPFVAVGVVVMSQGILLLLMVVFELLLDCFQQILLDYWP